MADPEIRSHKIELFAFVLKVVEDSGSADFENVYYELAKWKTDEKLTGYSSKAEKFVEKEVKDRLRLLAEKGWLKKCVQGNQAANNE
jgi:hypothetical protein